MVVDLTCPHQDDYIANITNAHFSAAETVYQFNLTNVLRATTGASLTHHCRDSTITIKYNERFNLLGKTWECAFLHIFLISYAFTTKY